jgi:hemoglobin
MSEIKSPRPVHDGRVLLVAESGLQSGEHLTAQAAAAKVDDFYEQIGGAEYFRSLCTRFYQFVSEDEILSPLFPERDWDRQARTLSQHFIRLWGENDLTEAWRPGLHRAHAHWVITRPQRLRWLELIGRAARDVGTPEKQLDELLTILKVASGEMMAVSRGAGIARGDAFHWDGSPIVTHGRAADAEPGDEAAQPVPVPAAEA